MKILYQTNLQAKDAASPKQGIVDTPLKQLPLGDINCTQGWLATQLQLVAEGITGRLPEFGPFFRPDTNGYLYPNVRKGWEELPYWLRGFYPLAVLTKNKKLLKIANQYIEALFASVQNDGWFAPSHLKAIENTEAGKPIPDLFPHMLLIDTLILHYTYQKDERVLKLLHSFYRFCLSLSEDQFLPKKDSILKWQSIRAGDMLEQLYWYYRHTNDGVALTLSKRVHQNILKSTCGFASTHAVDFAQRFAYDAIYSQQSGSSAHFARSEYEYEKYQKVYGQSPRGLFAADEQIRIGAIDPHEGYEPCGMVELCKNFYIMGRISGKTKFADRTEDLMLNHFPASFTPDYKQIHYITSANTPIASNNCYAATFNGSVSQDRSYQLFTPNNRCCGHNTGMGWPWYAMNLWQQTYDGGLAAYLYAPCEVDTTVNGTRIILSTTTDYPFKDSVSITVDSDGEFPLYFRVPGWCKDYNCSINGKTVYEGLQSGGWIRIEKTWAKGDIIRLTFKMSISLTQWPANGSVSVDMGPLTYSVRIKEEYRVVDDADALAYVHPQPHLWENYEILPTTPWNYGLCAESGDPSNFVRIVQRVDHLAAQPFEESVAPIVLKARAKKIPNWILQDETAAALQQSPIYVDTPEEEIELIPLGCARLRISCFPVVTDDTSADTWEEVPPHTAVEERHHLYNSHYAFQMKSNCKADKSNAPWEPNQD